MLLVIILWNKPPLEEVTPYLNIVNLGRESANEFLRFHGLVERVEIIYFKILQ